MRATLPLALLGFTAFSLICGADLNAAINVTKTNGQRVPVTAYTKTFDVNTNGWTVNLLQLYAPGQENVFEIHGSANETIDLIQIQANGPAAGSPVIVRVLSDAPGGVRAVNTIVQTGTAETILNKVVVNEDIGFVQVEAIGDLIAGRDVYGPITATTTDNSIRGVGTVQAARHVLGDVTADNGRILLVWAQNGNIGMPGIPINIRAKFSVYQVMGNDVYANINTRYNGGTGGFWALDANKFIGTLSTEKLILNPWNNIDGLIEIFQQFSGTISIGKSYTSPSQYIQLPLNGLGGQIIINADNVAGGAWTAPVRLGPPGTPNLIVLTGPRYSQTNTTVGGGAVGLVPFRLHDEACVPANGQTVAASGNPMKVTLRHFGPVVWSGTPITIDRRVAGTTGAFLPLSLSGFSISNSFSDPNTITVNSSSAQSGFVAGYQYRIRPTSQLRSGVPALPGVQWDQDYVFTVNATVCAGDVNASGAVNVDDLLLIINYWGPTSPAFPAADLDHNGMVNVDDLLIVINHWGVCH